MIPSQNPLVNSVSALYLRRAPFQTDLGVISIPAVLVPFIVETESYLQDVFFQPSYFQPEYVELGYVEAVYNENLYDEVL